MLGVARDLISAKGAVSEPVAIAMAAGALEHSRADIAIAITGFAGPAGPGDEEGPSTSPSPAAAARRGG